MMQESKNAAPWYSDEYDFDIWFLFYCVKVCSDYVFCSIIQKLIVLACYQ
jgi:hypothetical protein